MNRQQAIDVQARLMAGDDVTEEDEEASERVIASDLTVTGSEIVDRMLNRLGLSDAETASLHASAQSDA